MGVPAPASNPWWWLAGAVVCAGGLAMAGLGVLDRDNGLLIGSGLSAFSGSVGYLLGKRSPTP